MPDVMFGLYNELVIFDHVDKTIKVVANAVVKQQEEKKQEKKVSGPVLRAPKGAG